MATLERRSDEVARSLESRDWTGGAQVFVVGFDTTTFFVGGVHKNNCIDDTIQISVQRDHESSVVQLYLCDILAGYFSEDRGRESTRARQGN